MSCLHWAELSVSCYQFHMYHCNIFTTIHKQQNNIEHVPIMVNASAFKVVLAYHTLEMSITSVYQKPRINIIKAYFSQSLFSHIFLCHICIHTVYV